MSLTKILLFVLLCILAPGVIVAICHGIIWLTNIIGGIV